MTLSSHGLTGELNPFASSAFSNRANLFTATAPGQGSSSHDERDDGDDDGAELEEGKHQLRDLI